MLTANGLTLPAEEWAQRLNVAPFAIVHAVAEGLTMQAIVDLYMTDGYAPPVATQARPQTPPNLPAQHAGPIYQTPGGSFTFRTLCVNCADKAKNFYDMAHSAHKEQQRLEQQARDRAWADTMFDFVELPKSPDLAPKDG